MASCAAHQQESTATAIATTATELPQVSNEKRFFAEHAEMLAALHELVHRPSPDANDPNEIDQQFRQIHLTCIRTLNSYQEQPHLLDSHLKPMVDVLMQEISRVRDEFYHNCWSQATASQDIDMEQRDASSLAPKPLLLFPFQIYRNKRQHKYFQLVYQLTKIRGFKRVLKCFPHEVCDLEPTLWLLQCQDRQDFSCWENRYVLLLWLSLLCMIPFDLQTIDSSLATSDAAGSPGQSMVNNLLLLCKQYLADTGAIQNAAALCLARLLSRPDLMTQFVQATDGNSALHQVMRWATDQIHLYCGDGSDNSAGVNSESSVTITGIMLFLVNFAKFAPREQHFSLCQLYSSAVMRLIHRITDSAGSNSNCLAFSSTLHRKLGVKLVQRLGLVFLPPKVMKWRYQRGFRSLELNMGALFNQKTSTNTAPDKRHQQQAAHEEEPQQEDDLGFLLQVENGIDQLEEIVEVLLCGLRDRDTVVRWSAAKGIGRITGRLPFEFADDIVQSVLELFVALETDSAWHGASLALAELARRGILLPSRLEEAVDCITRALFYDVRRGAHSIGSHVRDAACYACWSFARAYDPGLLRPYLTSRLAPSMLITCVFDRELNCRRAASACFQENVGRQGHGQFPNGIELLTKADYFAVANLRKSYLEVSGFIGQSAEYRYHLIEHLARVKLFHWDVQIRRLASSALGRMTKLDPQFMMHQILPEMFAKALQTDQEVFVRHGATLAIAEITQNLFAAPVFLEGQLQLQMKQLVLEMDQKRLFRGRSGELVRCAACQVIKSVCICELNLNFLQIKKFVSFLEECLVHGLAQVRFEAIGAWRHFANRFFSKVLSRGAVAHVKWLRELAKRFVHQGILTTIADSGSGGQVVLNPNVAARSGYARAVGLFPGEMLSGLLDATIDTLIRGALITRQSADELNAESRVACVHALRDLCCRVGDSTLSSKGFLTRPLHRQIVVALLDCIDQDYGTDERGDVGSWIRKEAILAMEQLVVFHRRLQLKRLDGLRVQSHYGCGQIERSVLIGDEEADGFSVGVDMTGQEQAELVDGGVKGAIDVDVEEMEAVEAQERVHSQQGFGADARTLCLVQYDKTTLGFSFFPPKGQAWIPLHRLTLERLQIVGDSEWIPAMDQRLEFMQSMKPKPAQQKSSLGQRDVADGAALEVPPELVERFFGSLAKQLAEKLDNTRVVAGTVFFRLLHSTAPRIDGIPQRLELESTLLPVTMQINWSMASNTFPRVVPLLDFPEFHDCVLSGLVISLGALTENVLRASQQAVSKWFESHLRDKDLVLLRKFCFGLIRLLEQHHGEDRVTLPLLKTIGWLLESPMFVQFMQLHQGIKTMQGKTRPSDHQDGQQEEEEEVVEDVLLRFGNRLYEAVRDAIQVKATTTTTRTRTSNTSDVLRLVASNGVFVGLLPFDEPVRGKALRALLILLKHRFPVVRKTAAERFYTKLLVHDDLLVQEGGKYDAVLTILSETPWDATIDTVTGPRDRLFDILGLEKPMATRRSSRPPDQQVKAPTKDDGYQALVHEAGY